MIRQGRRQGGMPLFPSGLSPAFSMKPPPSHSSKASSGPNDTVYPQCGIVNGRMYDPAGVRGEPSKRNPEGAVRHGLKKWGECRKQFTVKVGLGFEDARLPLHLMLQAVHLMIRSKNIAGT